MPTWLLAPLLGCLIGYITNELAIRMLFRPRKAYYIGSWKLPFTPGLIPAQKSRIARSVGEMVSDQLLDGETVRRALVSDEVKQTLRERVISWLKEYRRDQRTIREAAESLAESKQIDHAADEVQGRLTEFFQKEITEANLGAVIAEAGIQRILSNGASGMMMLLSVSDDMIRMIRETLTRKINEEIERQAPGIIEKEAGEIREKIRNIRMYEIHDLLEEHIPAIADGVVGIYTSVMEKNAAQFVESVRIENIVAEKIDSFDAKELEDMIFGVMRRELRAIVYLGALLGFLMGFLNLVRF